MALRTSLSDDRLTSMTEAKGHLKRFWSATSTRTKSPACRFACIVSHFPTDYRLCGYCKAQVSQISSSPSRQCCHSEVGSASTRGPSEEWANLRPVTNMAGVTASMESSEVAANGQSLIMPSIPLHSEINLAFKWLALDKALHNGLFPDWIICSQMPPV